MNVRRLSTAAVILLAALPGSVDAQSCRRPVPGAPVRFVHDTMARVATAPTGAPVRPWRSRREYRDATFTALEGDTLRVTTGGVPAAFHTEEVTGLQVECPVSAAAFLGKGLSVGALVGGAAGLVLGLCNPRIDIFGEEGGCQGPTRDAVTGTTAAGALAGAVVGAVLGGLGALLSGGTEWQPVSMTAAPAASPGGEWTVGVRLPLGR